MKKWNSDKFIYVSALIFIIVCLIIGLYIKSSDSKESDTTEIVSEDSLTPNDEVTLESSVDESNQDSETVAGTLIVNPDTGDTVDSSEPIVYSMLTSKPMFYVTYNGEYSSISTTGDYVQIDFSDTEKIYVSTYVQEDSSAANIDPIDLVTYNNIIEYKYNTPTEERLDVGLDSTNFYVQYYMNSHEDEQEDGTIYTHNSSDVLCFQRLEDGVAHDVVHNQILVIQYLNTEEIVEQSDMLDIISKLNISEITE